MEKLIIGSTAMKYWFGDEFDREPKDLDYAVSEEYKGEKIKNTEFLYNPILDYSRSCEVLYIDPQTLLNLKISHLFWDNSWDKHMWDAQFLLKKGFTIDVEFVNKLTKFWDGWLPKIRRSELSQGKEDFFTNAVNQDKNEHDLLHTMLVETPAYTKLLKDECEVELDESKWWKLSEQEKRDVVNEETWVMAFERYDGKLHYVRGFRRQLKDNIIKHFPQYIALFAIENYVSLLNPPKEYIGKLKREIK